VIRLLHRQRAGLALDSEEALAAVEAIPTVVIGDVDHCRRKLRAIEAQGVDRLMCLKQFGALPHGLVMRSLRVLAKHLLPEF
jgi:hypothetical protein